jgi:1-acyl-sn-glycerol-3-phosphate acyltransferase
MNRLVTLLQPLSRLTQPHVEGIERIPGRGALFVGNHTLFGFLDLPFMMAELWKRREIVVRGLGDHAHYAIPAWCNLLERCGMVRGTRDNVRAAVKRSTNWWRHTGSSGPTATGSAPLPRALLCLDRESADRGRQALVMPDQHA